MHQTFLALMVFYGKATLTLATYLVGKEMFYIILYRMAFGVVVSTLVGHMPGKAYPMGSAIGFLSLARSRL